MQSSAGYLKLDLGEQDTELSMLLRLGSNHPVPTQQVKKVYSAIKWHSTYLKKEMVAENTCLGVTKYH
jgi:hypothetical protein